ncbi:N-acetylneuraminate synthase family protein [Fluviispira sanaruensis]|uniref:Acetylneuraminic acid synthetase n=1 Tax=Fluviispira sanaruensis TaxID=2493639 RepID=A0A4P2VLA4_FLUSA|nr:N-acetylneuraminate synthase family protein [Fluviispira sanaruensis]BBH54096.1 acetylneuraminic acid synthetase [Fluviispira sanaruensis]
MIKNISQNKTFSIGNRIVGINNPTFIIAEIGNNHNSDLKLAKDLVEAAIDCGVDAVKFQMRNMESLYGKNYSLKNTEADLSTQYTIDLLEKFQLKNHEMQEIFDYCKQKNIIAFCTPWDIPSVEVLNNFDIPIFKVASADLTNHQLLKEIAKSKKPMICSSGMSTQNEIQIAIDLLNSINASYAILHCNSTYPTPYKDVHLEYLKQLQRMTPIVGYSGHERGIEVPIAAVALGAKIIEKHFTFDKKMEGNDHRISLLPHEMKEMVRCIRNVEASLGYECYERKISQGELINRENLAKSIVAKVDINEGTILSEDMFQFLSPGKGLQPYKLQYLVNNKSTRNISAGEFLYDTDLPDEKRVKPKIYKFKRPWGVPVRYHDFASIIENSNPDLIEFHLSYKDIDENIPRFFKRKYSQGFVVHAPELFSGDHLLDLCSSDLSYKEKSIENMKRVVAITKELKKYFPNEKKPLIVANVGGFTQNAPLPDEARMPLYYNLLKSFKIFEDSEVELIPQTMAPFPWHMGGQQYQNLFKFPEECDWFCKEFNYRMCLDYSHAHLTCNFHGYTMKQYLDLVAPHTAHIHLGDAEGVDGEGLQIGEGEVNFTELAYLFDKYCPTASFIPEIWQGHKNEGEGFWIALEKLEKWF